jgi:competence protein ComEA
MHPQSQRLRSIAVLALFFVLLSASLIPPAAAQGQRAKTSSAAAPARPIDLNRAGADELTSVPGIGKTLAQRIVEFREQHGPFKRVEDLMKVKGIGEKSFEKIRPYVKVGAKR